MLCKSTQPSRSKWQALFPLPFALQYHHHLALQFLHPSPSAKVLRDMKGRGKINIPFSCIIIIASTTGRPRWRKSLPRLRAALCACKGVKSVTKEIPPSMGEDRKEHELRKEWGVKWRWKLFSVEKKATTREHSISIIINQNFPNDKHPSWLQPSDGCFPRSMLVVLQFFF